MNYKQLGILFSILTLFSMMNHSFESEELKNLKFANDLPDLTPIRIPARFGKRQNKFFSPKSNFIYKQRIMKWIQNYMKKKKTLNSKLKIFIKQL
jgi:hypothetical protein